MERNKNNNTSNDNIQEKTNKNNSPNTKTNESLKNQQIIVDYSDKNNFHLFKYLFFHYNQPLSELLWKRPLLFKEACKFFDWLIITFGQTKPWELIKLPKDGHEYYDCEHCGGKGNVKVVHHKHNYPGYFLKGDLSYHLITRGRAGLKTDNRIHPDADVAKNKEQEWREPWRPEALKQFKKWVDYLGLPLIPTPSGGCQTEYQKHWKQEVKTSNLYFNGKATNYEYLHFGENKAQGSYAVHPLSKDRLPELTEEFLLDWKKQQKRPKRFKYFSQKLITESAAKFGIYFTKQPPKKETPDTPITRDSSNDLVDTTIFNISWKQLTEQKTTNYHPIQFTFMDEPFGESRKMILDVNKPHWKKLATSLMKNDGSTLHFQLLQLSRDFKLQRWKNDELLQKWKDETQKWKAETSPHQSSYEKAIIPHKTGEVKTLWSSIVRDFDNFLIVKYRDASDNKDYSVLFNTESKGIKEPYLDNKIGNFATTFYLKAGDKGSFIKSISF